MLQRLHRYVKMTFYAFQAYIRRTTLAMQTREKDLQEWREAGLIDAETQDRIAGYLREKEKKQTPPLFALFAVIGALLTGGGISLLVAHNWDQLPQAAHLAVAIFLLLGGQALVFYTLRRRKESAAWRESSGILHYFSLGGCLAIISQEFYLGGDIDGFLLLWNALFIPAVFLLRSPTGSGLALAGSSIVAAISGYAFLQNHSGYLIGSLVLLSLLAYFYLRFLQGSERTHARRIHHWLWAMVVPLLFGILFKHNTGFTVPALGVLFVLYRYIGQLPALRENDFFGSGWISIGTVGWVVMMEWMGFREYWAWHIEENIAKAAEPATGTIAFFALLVLTAAVGVFTRIGSGKKDILDFGFVPIALALALLQLIGPWAAALFCNLWLFISGVLIMRKGGNEDNLGALNLGLAIVALVLLTRFFDERIDYLLRGLAFIATGIAFFLVNRHFMRKARRKEQEA